VEISTYLKSKQIQNNLRKPKFEKIKISEPIFENCEHFSKNHEPIFENYEQIFKWCEFFSKIMNNFLKNMNNF
jgi:hypothetical protein